MTTRNEHTRRFGIETDRTPVGVIFREIVVGRLRRLSVIVHVLNIRSDQSKDRQGRDSPVEKEKRIEGLVRIGKGQNTWLTDAIIIATEKNLSTGLVEENAIFVQFAQILIEGFFTKKPIFFSIAQWSGIIGG